MQQNHCTGCINFKIINDTGQVVNFSGTSASSMSMNVAELKAGIYVIEILNDGIKEMNQTFIKQ